MLLIPLSDLLVSTFMFSLCFVVGEPLAFHFLRERKKEKRTTTTNKKNEMYTVSGNKCTYFCSAELLPGSCWSELHKHKVLMLLYCLKPIPELIPCSCMAAPPFCCAKPSFAEIHQNQWVSAGNFYPLKHKFENSAIVGIPRNLFVFDEWMNC